MDTVKPLPWIMKQAPMRRMLLALSPLVLAAIWLYGWKSLAMVCIAATVGWIVERLMLRPCHEPVSQAVFVTTTIFALSLPPTIPLWMVALGSIVAVLFGKMVFGGFGRNVFNPAMVGRAFLYVSFGQAMTGVWALPLTGFLGNFPQAASAAAGTHGLFPAGFGAWSPGVDAITSATPLASAAPSRIDLLVGTVPGSLGESSAILIGLAAIYLIWTKTANWRIIVPCLVGFMATWIPLWAAEVTTRSGILLPDPLVGLTAGGVLFGIVFIATDPVSAAVTNGGRWIYGVIIGASTVLIRVFSVWPEGMMFAILLGNTFAPIIDWVIKNRKARPAPGATP